MVTIPSDCIAQANDRFFFRLTYSSRFPLQFLQLFTAISGLELNERRITSQRTCAADFLM
jgi:hypothetical protein